MSRALILGGSGHPGHALRDRSREGVEVIAAYRSRPIPGGIAFQFENAGALPDADVVIGSFPMARRLEGASETQIEEAVRAYVGRCGRARIVQLSTDAVFSGATGLYGERNPVDPTTPYGRAQAAVDAALLKYAANCLIVRTSFIFGWAGGHFDKRLAPFARGEKKPSEHRWAGNIFRAPTEVNFLAEAIWRAVERGTEGILNVAGPRVSIHDFFVGALEELGTFEMPPAHEETDVGVARDTSLHTARMQAELDLDSREVWEWYRNFMRRRPAA